MTTVIIIIVQAGFSKIDLDAQVHWNTGNIIASRYLFTANIGSCSLFYTHKLTKGLFSHRRLTYFVNWEDSHHPHVAPKPLRQYFTKEAIH